jgi:uncharacterized protein (DUF2384 family)
LVLDAGIPLKKASTVDTLDHLVHGLPPDDKPMKCLSEGKREGDSRRKKKAGSKRTLRLQGKRKYRAADFLDAALDGFLTADYGWFSHR